jgi:hypothetical protein
VRRTLPLAGDVCVQAIIAAAAAVASAAARAHICAPREECVGRAPQPPPLMVIQIATSTTYPVTTAKLFNDTGEAPVLAHCGHAWRLVLRARVMPWATLLA